MASLHGVWSTRWIGAAAIAFGLVPGMQRSAHAQSCPTIPSTVQVALSGSIGFPGGVSEAINSTLTHTQNASQCTDNPAGLSPLVCSYRTPFTAVLAAKILQIVDRPPQGRGLLDAACGRLNGTLTIGEPGEPLVNGTVSLQFIAPSTINAVINMSTTLEPVFFEGIPGRSTLAEQVVFSAPGRAMGTGTFRLELMGEALSVPFTIAYQLTGSPNTRPSDYLTVNTDLTYNCGSSQVTSRLCLTGLASQAVPLPRSASFGLGFGLLALGGLAAVGKRRRRS